MRLLRLFGGSELDAVRSEALDQALAAKDLTVASRIRLLAQKAVWYNYDAQPHQAYQVLEQMRSLIQGDAASSLEKSSQRMQPILIH